MGKKLTSEERDILRKSPHVSQVIGERISFTPEFKRMAYREMVDGKSLRTILFEHGINPEILGDSRIWGIAEKLRKNADRDEGFEDCRKQNQRTPAKATKEQSLESKISQLEHELAYTRQEVEFLKKIRLADLEAQKAWESKQRRK